MLAALSHQTRARLGIAAAGVCAVAVAVFLAVVNPATAGFLPPCPFHELSGLHCPGCGSTRALHHLLNGHLGAAFGLNLLMVISLPFLLYASVSYALRGCFGRGLPAPRVEAWMAYTLLCIILAFWILRNVPLPPFSYLAP
ncbi:MAG: DUF2752 domain-containing protein [bacterium]|nr:DUF2752 domain-containing protein [bacterium]